MDIKSQEFKKDLNKLRMDLIEPILLKSVAEVLTYGTFKYPENSWKLVENAKNRYYAATLRHLMEWKSENKFDNESNLNHLKHVAANIMFLIYLEEKDGKL
jgi:hypothetical protein